MRRALVGATALLATLAAMTALSAPAHAHPRRCIEVSEVVGHERCARFGTFWDASSWPRWTVSLAGTWRDLDGGSLRPTLPPALPTPSPGLFPAPAVGGGVIRGDGGAPVVRVGSLDTRFVYHPGTFYGGVETTLGLGSGHGSLASPDGPMGVPDTAFLAQGGLVFGVAGSLVSGRVTLSAEIFAGGRLLYLGCDGGGVGATCGAGSSALAETWLLGPRVGAAAWLNPHLAVGITLGADLEQRGDRSVGLSLAGSFEPYGGPGR